MDLSALRREYRSRPFLEADVDPDPFVQFARWFDEAQQTVSEANAMILATTGPDGSPDARTVLLKAVEEGAFVFYTNQDSAKGRAIASEPRVALLFAWLDIARQVRITGRASPVARSRAEVYFAQRPRASQLGAWASAQSTILEDRAALDAAYADAAARFEGSPVPCPPRWGGYAVVPDSIELWQGRESRLHDRLRYTRVGDGWRIVRLAP